MNYSRLIIVFVIIVILAITAYSFKNISQSLPQLKISDNASKKIASFSASITELIYYLNFGDMLVANTDYCNYPEEAKYKFKIGSLGNINYELLVALGVNVAIVPKYMEESTFILKGYGIETIIVDHNTINGILDSISKVESFFRGSEGKTLGNDVISTKLDKLEKNKPNSSNKKRVLFVVFHDIGNEDIGTITVAANDGYYSDMIFRAGGYNIFSDISAPYPVFDKEVVLISNPDVIIELLKPGDNKENIFNEWMKLKDINAVKNNQLYLLDDISHSIPGPRFIDTLETIVNIICDKEVSNASY